MSCPQERPRASLEPATVSRPLPGHPPPEEQRNVGWIHGAAPAPRRAEPWPSDGWELELSSVSTPTHALLCSFSRRDGNSAVGSLPARPRHMTCLQSAKAAGIPLPVPVFRPKEHTVGSSGNLR